MFLLDTNVVSELRKVASGRADPNVARWANSVRAEELYLSAITVYELELGVRLAEREDGAKGAILRGWLDGQVVPTFAGRILPLDMGVARRSAALHVPDPRPERDALIAGTALVHAMPIVTRNVPDFLPMGVRVIDPWAFA